jgi:hypothetical protein
MLLRNVFLISLFSSSLAFADGWEITQSANSTSIHLFQNGSRSSDQSINNISVGQIKSSSQSLTVSGDLSLTQGGSHSKQSINSLSSGDITNRTTQTVSLGSIALTSDGANNLQIGNYIQAATINNATQQFNATKMTFNGNGSGNKQAGNYLKADQATASQIFSANSVSYSQSGENNIQAGNMALTNNFTTGGTVTQGFTVEYIDASYSKTDDNGSIKAANYYTY